MIIYSSKIVQFIQDIKTSLKSILSQKIGLKVNQDRFYDRKQTASYPIKVVIYSHKTMLGYFDPLFYELGFHECLMRASREQLNHVIHHELAHYLFFIEHGSRFQAHGPEFRAFCRAHGWAEEVSNATMELASLSSPDLAEDSVLRKVQKLMALATSGNPHEAEQAMVKSQQLLLKHNLNGAYLSSEEQDKYCLKRIMKQSKETAKMRAIARILQTFFVNVVYSRSEEHIYLEILGSKVNIEIAEYVADLLQGELERLWDQIRLTIPLKGMIAKNSFFLGIAQGYCEKIQALKQSYQPDVFQALMVIEKQLVDAKEMAYPRLKQSKSQGRYCSTSASLGQQLGKNLQLNPALKEGKTNSGLMIPHM